MSDMSSSLAPDMKTFTKTPAESSLFVAAIFFYDYKYDMRTLELVGRSSRNQYRSKRSDVGMQNESVRYETGKEKN